MAFHALGWLKMAPDYTLALAVRGYQGGEGLTNGLQRRLSSAIYLAVFAIGVDGHPELQDVVRGDVWGDEILADI